MRSDLKWKRKIEIAMVFKIEQKKLLETQNFEEYDEGSRF